MSITGRDVSHKRLSTTHYFKTHPVMKNLARNALKAMVKRFPWGANEAIFEALLARMGPDQIFALCSTGLDHLQLCASGSYGLIQSAVSDGVVLPVYARTGAYEPRLAELFHEFFATHGGGTYLDIGANIGLTTIPVAQDLNVKCLAFEPDPVNSRHLRANVERNCPHHNVTVHQTALFFENSTLNFALNKWNPGDHRLSLTDRGPTRTIQVKAAPLDQFLEQVEGAVAAKIDTQGAEPFVIAGGRRVLSRVNLIAVEFAPYLMRELNGDPEVVLEFLAQFEQIAIETSTEGAYPIFRPAVEGLRQLRTFLSEWRKGDSRYWDVFASRGNGGGPAARS
jgi:FkbM family methyltransferase